MSLTPFLLKGDGLEPVSVNLSLGKNSQPGLLQKGFRLRSG
jgi:hypothetical protein